MIEAMEVLLCAWGHEVMRPNLEVGLRSPLGAMGEEGARGVGGHRCLSSIECYVEVSRGTQAVDMALAELLRRDAAGRVLHLVASVRYCNEPRLAVAEQCRRLVISQRTYRTRVDELHATLAEVLPAMARRVDDAERGSDAFKAQQARARKAREAGKDAARKAKQQAAQRKAFARSVLAAASDA